MKQIGRKHFSIQNYTTFGQAVKENFKATMQRSSAYLARLRRALHSSHCRNWASLPAAISKRMPPSPRYLFW
jgi:hypothetical protein